jgi:hypothetical protein
MPTPTIPIPKERVKNVPPIITPTPPPKYENYELKNLSNEQRTFLENTVFPITRGRNIPDALAASQWAEEGGRRIASPINNLFGLGPGIKYPTMEAGINAYADTLHKILNKKGYTVEDLGDAYQILMKLQEATPRYEGDNDDPYSYTHNIMNTPEWKYYYR